MSDNFQLNIIIPKKGQENSNNLKNSKQKRFEKYVDRKKKRTEKKANHSSILHPRISKEFPPHNLEANLAENDSKPYKPASSFQARPILKKAFPTNAKKAIENPENPQNNENAIKIDQEPEKPIFPSIFTSTDFDSLSISNHLKQALKASKYLQMTKIQQAAIPVLLTKANSLIKSETGSGKTLCYLIPIYELLMQRTEKITRGLGTLALILCPTRELCIQVDEEARKLSKAAIWIVNGSIMGGEAIKKEKSRLRKGINILISTPGRLCYHLQNSTSFLVENLQFLILEESDRTLDMGFSRDVELMIDLLSKRSKDWEKVQKILISANFSQKIKTLTLKMSTKKLNYIGWEPQNSEKTAENAEKNDNSEFFQIDEMLKIPKSISQQYTVLKEEYKTPFLLNFLRKSKKAPLKIVIFVATIDEVEYHAYLLKILPDLCEKYKVFKLHGDIDQKTRTLTYLDFKKKSFDFSLLIATDVASRGLDFTCVDTTILTSIPARPIDYCNSIGRTGRIDQSGVSILLLYEQELAYLEELKKNGIDELKKFWNFNRNEHYDKIRKEIVNSIRNDHQLKVLAKRAYVSFMRAYNRNQKGRFVLKELNILGIAKNFGIEGGKIEQDEEYQQGIEKRKEFHRENSSGNAWKQPVIRSVKDLERMEFG